jgi:surfactin synthase thioesterase subunit
MKKIKLFCLPYAGGSSTIYLRWKQNLHSGIELNPIELAGRGRRYGETLYNSLDEIAEDVYSIIKKDIDNCDYALFGHSLGSIVAYELAHKIQSKNEKMPMHIFFAGKRAPHFDEKEEVIHHLPDEEFKHKVLELGGTPKEIVNNQELLDLFLPILRADFKVNETYKYLDKNCKLGTDITVINGKQEEMSLDEITGWKQHTNKGCKIFMLDGDHFFINIRSKEIIDIINSTLIEG